MRYFWISILLSLALIGGSLAFQACSSNTGGSAGNTGSEENVFTLSGDTL